MTLHDSFGGAYSYLRNIRSRKMTTIQIPLAEYEKLKADAERFQWMLDNCEKAESILVHLGPSYWRAEIDAAIKQEGGA